MRDGSLLSGRGAVDEEVGDAVEDGADAASVQGHGNALGGINGLRVEAEDVGEAMDHALAHLVPVPQAHQPQVLVIHSVQRADDVARLHGQFGLGQLLEAAGAGVLDDGQGGRGEELSDVAVEFPQVVHADAAADGEGEGLALDGADGAEPHRPGLGFVLGLVVAPGIGVLLGLDTLLNVVQDGMVHAEAGQGLQGHAVDAADAAASGHFDLDDRQGGLGLFGQHGARVGHRAADAGGLGGDHEDRVGDIGQGLQVQPHSGQRVRGAGFVGPGLLPGDQAAAAVRPEGDVLAVNSPEVLGEAVGQVPGDGAVDPVGRVWLSAGGGGVRRVRAVRGDEVVGQQPLLLRGFGDAFGQRGGPVEVDVVGVVAQDEAVQERERVAQGVVVERAARGQQPLFGVEEDVSAG